MFSSSGSADDALETAMSASSMVLTRSSKSSRRKGKTLPMPHPFSDLIVQGGCDEMRIFTPPSSPEPEPGAKLEGELGGARKLKASDWIKQVMFTA